MSKRLIFLSTLSARRATVSMFNRPHSKKFLSTLSARRATVEYTSTDLHIIISIHALRKESDRAVNISCALSASISIHALRKESDYRAPPYNLIIQQFLSTLSARRATTVVVVVLHIVGISIHALRKESDIGLSV